MINKHVNKSSGIEIIAFYTSHFSCSYHAAWHAHEHILNINHAACLSFFLSCNIKRWYLINFPINYENRIYFLPISILSCRFFTCYGVFFTIMHNLGSSCGSFCLNLHQHGNNGLGDKRHRGWKTTYLSNLALHVTSLVI